MEQNNYNMLCDDFFLDMYVNTKLELPFQRDTVLSFFERIQKQFPTMSNFHKRDNSVCLEEDTKTGNYRWAALETDRIGSGVVNPQRLEDAYTQDRFILELIPYMLGVNHLDADSLDVTFGMDFEYSGSHDEVIAEALLSSSGFSSLLEMPGCKPIDCSPAVVFALSDDCLTQARISIESKTSIFDPREKEQTNEKAISLLFNIRQYSQIDKKFDLLNQFENQCRLAEELMETKVVPNFVKPLTNVIAQKRFI
jgi:hypothetical protein